MSGYLEIVSAADKVKKLNFLLFERTLLKVNDFQKCHLKLQFTSLPKIYIHQNFSNWACCNSHEHLNLVHAKVLKL